MEIYNQKMKWVKGEVAFMRAGLIIWATLIFLAGFAIGTLFAKDNVTVIENVVDYSEGVNLTSIEAWIYDDARTPEDFNALLGEISNAIE